MRWSDRRERFRALLAGDACVFPGSVFDPISARIAEDVGYEVAMLAGSIASFGVLGNPDMILITLSEFAEQVRRICRAGNLPLMVDADHGYGNALNVMRTVEELESAGLSGLSIEDTILPMVYGAPRDMQILSIEEGAGKMRAAVEARRDPKLVIAGRTSAIALNGLDDTIARLKAYQDAGVDMLFIIGVKTKAQLEAIAAEVRLPMMLGGAGPEIFDLTYLASQGVRVCLQGHQPFAAAVQAVHATMTALRAGTPGSELENLASPDLMKSLTRAEDHERWVDDFLGGGQG